jgi:nucleotide-binding universal stress UspA family protein
MCSTLLVATDGGESAEATARLATDVAEARGAARHALFVIDQTYPSVSGLDFVVEEEEAEGVAALDAVAAKTDGRNVDIVRSLRTRKAVRGGPPLRFRNRHRYAPTATPRVRSSPAPAGAGILVPRLQ